MANQPTDDLRGEVERAMQAYQCSCNGAICHSPVEHSYRGAVSVAVALVQEKVEAERNVSDSTDDTTTNGKPHPDYGVPNLPDPTDVVEGKRYRRKQLAPIEAVQWNGHGDDPRVNRYGDSTIDHFPVYEQCGFIEQDGHIEHLWPGCWIVTEPHCIMIFADGAFQDLYEPVE